MTVNSTAKRRRAAFVLVAIEAWGIAGGTMLSRALHVDQQLGIRGIVVGSVLFFALVGAAWSVWFVLRMVLLGDKP